MIISYAASAQVSLESEAGVQSVDVGGDADQSSLALGTLCHTFEDGSTSDHVSGVSGIGSHFLIALQVVLKTVLIKALLD
tara:strand:- start:88 stop:327 length:240 start_codon:yes stop_codon:yes gene_type:complete